MTPSPVEDPPAVPAQPPPPVQAPPAPATTLSEEKPDGSNPPMSGSRRVKKRGKKVKKTAKTNTENTGTAAAASDQVRHEASLAPSHSGEATRPSEPHAPLESQPARVQPEPTPGSAPVQPKPAAKKALAKPPKRVHDNQPGSEATCAEMVKAQATPQGREALYREAVHEALQRLGTEQQFTPAETISPGSVRKPPAQEPDDDDDDNATQHYEAQDDSNIDFEEALDRAIKKEPTEAEEGCNQLVVPEAQQQGAQQQGTQQLDSNGRPKRQRREKTPAEKAAHARYMKFSRSFERTLTVYACSQPNDAKVVIEKHHRKNKT